MLAERRTLLAAVLALSVCLNAFHLWWGLPPNGNSTWAADAIDPLTPLAIAKKSFAHPNSGWFYFKYPIGHPLLLLAVYGPYLGTLYATGDFRHPQDEYPYGFARPERALTVLSLIGRGLSVLMATAAVALVYGIGVLLFDAATGVLAAAVAAVAMVMVFYAHTTNLDVPVTFWMLLAVFCALRLCGAVRWRDCIGLAAAAGMGFATKESAAGFLVVLPVLIAAAQVRRRPWAAGRLWQTTIRLGSGAVLAVLVYGVASNAFYNPQGLINRWRFLTNTLPREYFGTLVPRAAYINVTGGSSLATHLRLLHELVTSLADAMGIPLFAAAVAGMLIAAVTKPRALALCGLLGVTYYYVGLAALPLVAVRYVLPLVGLLAVFAGVCLCRLLRWGLPAQALVAALLLSGLLRAASIDYLLTRDPRYAAESWLRTHARDRTVETYNRVTFLPRLPRGMRYSTPGFQAITVQGLQERRPDFIVLSIADISRVTGRYDLFDVGVDRRPENEALLDALLGEQLAYRPIARFHAWSPLVRDGTIRSLNPEIVVFARS